MSSDGTCIPLGDAGGLAPLSFANVSEIIMNVQTPPVVAGSKGLWVAVGLLSVAVAGLGAALIVQHHASPASGAEPSSLSADAPSTSPELTHGPAVPPKSKVWSVAKAPAGQRPANAMGNAPMAYAPPAPIAPPACADCATVVAVTPIEHEGSAGGAGAVAGGLLGALVGNQFGRGSGKDALTVLGAIGGGVAGNQIEKTMKKVTTYRVDLRMDDGRTAQLEVSHPAGVGQRVRLQGRTLEPLSPDHG